MTPPRQKVHHNPRGEAEDGGQDPGVACVVDVPVAWHGICMHADAIPFVYEGGLSWI